MWGGLLVILWLLKYLCIAVMLTYSTLVWLLMYTDWLRVSDPCHLEYSISATLKLGLAAKPRLQTKSMRARLLSCACAPQSIGGLQSATDSSQFHLSLPQPKWCKLECHLSASQCLFTPTNEGTRSSFDVKWHTHGCVFVGVKESTVSLSFPSCSHTPPSVKQGELRYVSVHPPSFVISLYLFPFP